MPQRGIMAPRGQSFWSEKISIEPDLGDQRKSIFKALPRPPTTPKRVLMKYRFTALIPALLAVGSFVLMLVVLLAGTQNNLFSEHYLVALNTTRLGQDVIRFDTANSTSPAPSTTSSPTSPLSPLNPFSSDNPLNPSNPNSPFRDLNGILDPLVNNVTNAIDNGLSGAINELTTTIVTNAGIKDHYLIYLQRICSGSRSSNTDSFRIDKCQSWGDASKDLSSRLSNLKSSVMIGRTTISIPLLANLTQSLSSASSTLSTARTAAFVFLIIALTTTLLYVVTTIPGIIFPHSRLLVYINALVPIFANISTLLAAVILTIMVILTSFLQNIADAVGVSIVQGRLLLLFIWLSWALLLVAVTYWAAVWFVEVRRWAFRRRNRTKEEVGDWRGVVREVLRDVKGKNE